MIPIHVIHFAEPSLSISYAITTSDSTCPGDVNSTSLISESNVLVDKNLSTCLQVPTTESLRIKVDVNNNDKKTTTIDITGAGLQCVGHKMEVFVSTMCAQKSCNQCSKYQTCSIVQTSNTKCTIYCTCTNPCDIIYMNVMSGEEATEVCEFTLF